MKYHCYLHDVVTNTKDAFSIFWYRVSAPTNALEMQYTSLWWVSYSLIKTKLTASSVTTKYRYKIYIGDGRVSIMGVAKVFFKDLNGYS